MFRLCYFIVSALWSFLMSLALSTILWVSIFGDLNTDPAGFGVFEILSVLGMLWIPVALVVAARGLDEAKGKIPPWYKQWTVLIPLGHCLYYLALIAIPVVALPIFPHAFENYSYRYFLSAAMIYLLLLGMANSVQVNLCARRM